MTASRSIARVARPIAADVMLPGSKSIALRHLLMSTLAEGTTQLAGIPRCDDVDAMLDAVGRLGMTVERDGKSVAIMAPPMPFVSDVALDLQMSGVSLRLLLAHAALRTSTTRFTGHRQLHQRPNADLLDALRIIGCEIESTSQGRLPITVAGPASPAAQTMLATGVSSQYLTGLMLSAPGLPSGLTITLKGERTSVSYVDVTATEMAKRGIDIDTPDEDSVVVPPGRYLGGDVVIEGDASAATYHAALATLHGGRVTFKNLGDTTRQGDYAFLEVCERMGATIARGSHQLTIQGPGEPQAVGDVDMIDMPDAAPTLMAMAPFLPAPTHISGLATLRVKECDRIACGTNGLRAAGVQVEEFDDAMTIHPADAPRAAGFDPCEDHRMAMAFSVVASKVGGCVVHDAGCVSKTYADYWDDFDRVCRSDPAVS